MNFYNPTLNEKIIEVYNKNTVDKFTSPYNLVPTMLDILGVDYNSSMYPAKSVFSRRFQENGDIFYSYELNSFFTDLIWIDNDGNIVRNFADDKKITQNIFILIEDFKNTQQEIDSLYEGSIQ